MRITELSGPVAFVGNLKQFQLYLAALNVFTRADMLRKGRRGRIA